MLRSLVTVRPMLVNALIGTVIGLIAPDRSAQSADALANPTTGPNGVLTSKWSESVDGILARLRIEYTIGGDVRPQQLAAHTATVEFKNVSGKPRAIGNWFRMETRIVDSLGKEVASSPVPPGSALFIGPKWATIPVGAYVGWPADSRCRGIDDFRFTKGEGFAYLEIGNRLWKLAPGRYSVQSRVSSDVPEFLTKKKNTTPAIPENRWTGTIVLPPAPVVVTSKHVLPRRVP